MYSSKFGVMYMGVYTRQQLNPYSNTYNPCWSELPNFSWKGNNSLNPPQTSNHHPPKNNLEELLTQYIKTTQSN